jgi:hypothetical protein
LLHGRFFGCLVGDLAKQGPRLRFDRLLLKLQQHRLPVGSLDA